MVNKIKACIFISGKGSNLKSIIKSSRDYIFPIKIELIISNNHKATGLDLAKKYMIHINFFHQKIEKPLKENVYLKLKRGKLSLYAWLDL